MAFTTVAVLVLLDVIAELGVHEGLTATLAAGLQILRPQKLFVDAVPLKLFADVIEVRHLPGGADPRSLGEQLFPKTASVMASSSGHEMPSSPAAFKTLFTVFFEAPQLAAMFI